MKVLSISKKSDFTSATYLLGKGFLEIDLEPDHRKVIVYSKDLAKISRSYLRILLGDCYLQVTTFLERTLRRKKWVSKNYFELSSLINMYTHTHSLIDLEKKYEELELLLERIERVFKQYKRRPFNKIKKLEIIDNRTEAFLDNMTKAANIIYEEVIKISSIYDRSRKVKTLIHALRESIIKK